MGEGLGDGWYSQVAVGRISAETRQCDGAGIKRMVKQSGALCRSSLSVGTMKSIGIRFFLRNKSGTVTLSKA